MHKVVLLFLFLIASVLAQTASSLSGTVRDPQGAVVKDAEVILYDRLSGQTKRTASNAEGVYRLVGLSEGEYRLEAQASASALSASMDLNVQGGMTHDIVLEVARLTDRVSVTATSTPISDREVTRAVDVIDAQQINERDEYALAEVLRALPGVQIQTQVGGVTQIRTRGLRNQDTAVLIDGLRFRDVVAPQGDASGFLSDMNVTDLGRVEFLRGSGSSLYGTNAIAGTLNLNSNDGGGKMHGSIRGEGGGLGFARGTANIAGGLKSDKFVYSAGASYLNVSRGVRGRTPNKNSSGEAFAKYFFTPKTSLSGRVWGSRVFQRSVDSPAFTPAILANFPPAPAVVSAIPLGDSQMALYETKQPFSAGSATFIPSVPDPDGSRNSSFLATAFIFRQELTPTTSWRASYQRVATRRDYRDGPAGAQSGEPLASQISNFNGDTDQLQLRLDSRLGWFGQVTGGYEFEREDILSLANRPVTSTHLIRATANQISHSLYAQNQMQLLNGRLQIVFGGRLQKFDLAQPTFTGATSPYETTPVKSPENAYTGDLSASYFVGRSNTKFRGHFGNGYRAPSLFERFGSGYSEFTSAFTYYGDPRLRPEKSKSFDAGIDQWLFNSRMRASATYFYTDLSETIIFDSANFPPNDPFGRFFGYRNSAGGGISRGVELSTQFSLSSKTSVSMSYTFVNSEQRTPSIGTTFFDSLRTARHIYSLTGTQWFTSRLSATVDYYAIGDQLDSPFGAGGRIMQFPGPKKVDLVVNYKLPLKDNYTLDIYGKAENLTNRRYTDNGFLAPQAWAIGGIKFNF